MNLDESKNDKLKVPVLTVAVISAFLTAFMGSSINLALPTIGAEFNIDAILLSWLATAYLLSSAVFLVPVGRISDIYGRKKIFLSGMLLFTVSSLSASLATGVYSLLVCRIIQGIGSSMVFATGLAIVTSVFPLEERGKAIGFTIAAVYTGLSFGPFAGGLLTEYLGWRSIFIFTALMGVGGIYLLLKRVPGEWAEAAGEPFDLPGSLIYGVSLFLLIFGFSRLPSAGGFIFLATGLTGIVIFIIFELSIDFPVMQIRLFRNNPVFAWSNVAALINYSATFAVGFTLSLYLQYVKELSARDAGIILVSQPVIMAFVSLLAGRLSDRIEPRILATAGMSLTSIGLFVFVFIEEMNTASIVANLMFMGIGFGLFSSPNSNAIMSSVNRKYYGIASGIMSTMRLTGQMFSMGMIMLILSLYIGREAVTINNLNDFIQSMRMAFLIL